MGEKAKKSVSYELRIKRRVRVLWAAAVCMVVYMVIVVELGGGDSRVMTPAAVSFSKLFFPGLAFLFWRIYANKKLLKNRRLLDQEERERQDERNRYLHDKSGGLPMDLMLGLLLLAAWTASLFHMGTFYTCLGLLAAAVLLKLGFYLFYSRGI